MKTPTGEQVATQYAGRLGRTVLYCLTDADAAEITARALKAPQSHGRSGNDPHGGDVFPMIIVAHLAVGHATEVNGRVFLDGNDILWVGNRVQAPVSQQDRRGFWFEMPA